MASLTSHYQLQKLNAGDPFSTNGQKYTLSDRDEIDRLLYLGAEGHHHTGAAATQGNPVVPGSTAVSTSGGTLPSGAKVYYEYTWVDPNGFETAPSPAIYATMPSQTTAPNPPSVVASTASGTLAAGAYFYVLTAYTGTTSQETTPSSPGYSTLSAEGENVITLPTLPSGATGFNIYQRGPGGINYLFLASVAVTGGSPATYTDDGSVAVNCNRYSPTQNTTTSANSVVFTLPTAAPTGFTWNLYRTLTSGQWTSSLLANVANDVSSYTDTGAGTLATTPPLSSELPGAPSKILLTGGAEVQGTLPTANIEGFPQVVTFAFPGAVTAQTGTVAWTCEYASATIVSVRASLGRSSTPASQDVIVDVLKLEDGSYTSIFGGATPTLPFVPVGEQIGAAQPTDMELVAGDSLSCDITQAGGGATPTDSDLTINVYVLVNAV